MRISDNLRKSVVFILRENKPKDWQFLGAGFLVSKRIASASDTTATYLVTAKRVVNALEGKRFAIRVNKHGGGSEMIISKARNSEWFDHPEHEEHPADVSVIRLPQLANHLDVQSISTDMFLKKEEMQYDMNVGDKVCVVDLFADLFGKQRNSAVLRGGNIALIPGQKIPSNGFGNMEAYLIEVRALRGIWGTPVFATPSDTTVGYDQPYLMGLVHDYLNDPAEITYREPIGNISTTNSETNNRFEYDVHMSISVVTPGFKILEAIEHPDLLAQEHEEARNAPVAIPASAIAIPHKTRVTSPFFQ